MAQNELTGSEAVYGFVAWLTTRTGAVTFGASHDCTEHRLAELFEPGMEGFAVLQALAYQGCTKYTAAKLIQKLLKGHQVNIPVVDVTKPLKPYPADHIPEPVTANDSDD